MRLVGRKVVGEAEARACLGQAGASGLARAEWARANGVNPRSLNAWRLILDRKARGARTPALRLVELVAASDRRAGEPLYAVRVGELRIVRSPRFSPLLGPRISLDIPSSGIGNMNRPCPKTTTPAVPASTPASPP